MDTQKHLSFLARWHLVGLMLCTVAAGQQRYWPDGPDAAKIVFVREVTSPEHFSRPASLVQKAARLLANRPPLAFVQPLGIDVKSGLLAVADPGAGGTYLIDAARQRCRFLEPAAAAAGDPTDVAWGNGLLYVTQSGTAAIDVFDRDGKRRNALRPRFEVGRFVGVAWRAPNLMVADVVKHHVVVMDLKGSLVRRIGARGADDGNFNFPLFVASGPAGALWVTDALNFRVQCFSSTGGWVRTVGGQGVMSGQMNRPKGIATDPAGHVFVADASFDNIQIFSAEGSFLLNFGATGSRPGEFRMPTDVAVEGDTIYVTDTMNKRIQVFHALNE